MSHWNTAQKYTLAIILLTSFTTPFMGSAVNLAIPAIGAYFDSGTFMLSWVINGYLLASAALLLPFGKFADVFGRKKVFLWGLIVFTLSSLLCGLAWSVQSLVLFRIIQGIGSAAVFSTGMAILTLAYPPQERGKVLGINAATVYIGLSLGPVLGGALNQHIGWQSIFYLFVLLGLPVIWLTSRKLQTDHPTEAGETQSFDMKSAGLYSIGLGLLLYGLSAVAAAGSFARIAAAAGLLLLFLFIRRQEMISQPLININLFLSNAVFAFFNLAALINYSATFAVGFLLSIHLQVIMGYDSQTSGLIMLSQPVLMALLSPFAGTLSDRIAPRIIASWGMGLTALGLALFIFIGLDTPIWFIIANLSLLGIGFAFFSSPNNNAVMGSVQRQHYGIAGSTLGTMRLVGQALSMSLATVIIDYYSGGAQLLYADPVQLLKGFQIIFIIFATACFLGIFASMARENVQVEEENV